MKINLLDSLIYNRIAAGEVVEKPASVVKELVENSIDAGSAEITISIQNGGIDNITITDNGCGIDVSDIKNAFLPHATSKISKIDDLDSICTLGFRGEALPSIASVSKITVKSKTLNSEIGCKLTVIGGICGEVENCACNEGTVFEVNNLFYNTPARAKFLKKAKTEENNISQVVTQLILANPDVAFKYIVEGKTIYKTIGNGLENIIYDVYQPNIAKNLLQVSFENNGYKIFGYVSNNNLTKPNKSYQTTIVNGRFIVNNTISTAVTQAYGNNLMKRCYPVYVLNLIIPFDDLDVNVTPNKSDVRFIDSQIIFSLVYRAVKDALLKNSVVYNEMTNESSKNANILQHNNESSKNANVLQDNNESSKNTNVLQDNNTNSLTNDSNSVLNKVDNYNNTPNLELNNGNNQKNISFIPQVKGSSVADKLFVDFSNNAKPLTNVEDFEYFEKTDKSLSNNKNKPNCNVKFENDNNNINIGNKNNNNDNKNNNNSIENNYNKNNNNSNDNDNKNNYIVTNENCNANNSEICNAKNEIYGENNSINNENLNNGVNLKQNTFEEDIFATAENYLNKPTFA
ncbi:MAG: DNA mismatch repair endonuclease MutL, partial [Clostridia bacterium]